MSQSDLSLNVDDNLEDLPRTLRREREAQDRAAAEAAAADKAPPQSWAQYWNAAPEARPATVTALNVPFVHLVWFFLKAVFAAIPALILLGAVLWLIGDILTAYFPWLVKVKVLIHIPQPH